MYAIHETTSLFKSIPDPVDVAGCVPVFVEGVLEFETLCPVSKVTGHRANALTLLKLALSDKNSRLLDAILQEVPVIQQMSGVDDNMKLELLASRLSVGTLAEQDLLVSQLQKVADVLFPQSPEIAKAVSDQSIKFERSDVSDASPDAE